ncbi:MAG TPA: sigma factor-like helix-turn-helix DNA-binding protein [Mycobacteriales bacterium]|nr:sigma factor-like helix-turn-helix DNA-binding protein [Mycobacteriales bacterium]
MTATPTAWHVVRNRQRAAQRRHLLLGRLANEASTDPLARDPADSTIATDVATEALRRLSPVDQEAVRLICWEGLSLTEAASVMRCSEVALKVRLHRARRRLAAHLNGPEQIGQGQRVEAIR